MIPLLSRKEKVEFSSCIRWFATGNLFNKRPECYLKYAEVLALPVIEVRYLAIKYQIIKPRDWSMKHREICKVLAAFLYSTKTSILRIEYNGKQILI
jgi:hypothetical protein